MRRHAIFFFLCGVCLAAPTEKATPPKQEVGNEVEQLDQLRRENEHRNVEVVRTEESHLVDVNGHREQKTDKEKVVLSDGKLIASSKQSVNTEQESPENKPHSVLKTQVDVPQLGIHRTSISDSLDRGKMEQEKKNSANWYTPEDRERSEEHYNKYSGVQYTPTDLADYIIRTGDEEGVALAIEELLREGMIGREEAIQYLQEVKNELDFMRNRYDRSRRIEDDTIPANIRIQQAITKVPNQTNESKQQNKIEKMEAITESPTSNAPQQTAAKYPAKEAPPTPTVERRNKAFNYRQFPKQDEVDVSDVLEKLKTASTMREEYTLEEIIYQLSKDMFAQSLLRGDPTAEESLTKIASFLESEVMNNRISRDMEQRILDIVSAALIETLREFPGLLQENQLPVYEPDRNAIYRQQLAANHNIERRANSDPDISAKIANSARQGVSLTSNNVADTEEEHSNQKQPKIQQKA